MTHDKTDLIRRLREATTANNDAVKVSHGPHPSHKTRISDASTFDEICTVCGATDIAGGGWGKLADPCPGSSN